ncbi:MAG: signal peptidase II [Deltaproteobacteria bacterium]|nr:signal peptidase II [Deltaproteobacteria bacterium]
MRKARPGLLLAIVFVVLVCDQWSKALALSALSPVYQRPVIEGFFSLTLVMNSGVAFGLFSRLDLACKAWFLLGFSALTVLGVLYYYFFEPNLDLVARWGLALVVGGAVGNMIDRWRFQKVVDFLDFYVGSYHWPAFNVADAAISVGVGLLLCFILRQGRG